MGTRAIIEIRDHRVNETIPFVSIYNHYDGYPSELGQRIKNILNKGNVKILNGVQDQKCPEAFNGIDCMAAYLVGKLKGDEIGNIYLTFPGSREEYLYILYENKTELFIEIFNSKEIRLYAGLLRNAEMDKI